MSESAAPRPTAEPQRGIMLDTLLEELRKNAKILRGADALGSAVLIPIAADIDNARATLAYMADEIARLTRVRDNLDALAAEPRDPSPESGAAPVAEQQPDGLRHGDVIERAPDGRPLVAVVDSRGFFEGNPAPFPDGLDDELRAWLEQGRRALARIDEWLDELPDDDAIPSDRRERCRR